MNINMRKILVSTSILAAIVVFVVSLLSACKENVDNNSQNTGSGITVSTASKTTPIKTTVKTTIVETTVKSTSSDTQETIVKADNTESNTIEDERTEDVQEEAVNNSSGDDQEVEEVKVIDLKGREIKFLIADANHKPSNPKPDTGNKVFDLRYKRMKEAEELFNCTFKFEVVPGGLSGVRNKLEQSSMAGVYFADAVRLSNYYVFPKFEKNGLVLAMSDYYNFAQPAWLNFNQQYKGLVYPEKTYALYECLLPWSFGLWYHNDILSREGIPPLYELNNQGNWNWDMFLDVAIRTTKDFNGDGIIDQFALVTQTNTMIATSFIHSNGQKIIDFKDNKYIYNLDDVKVLKCLQFVSDLFNSYKIIPNMGNYKVQSMFTNNQAAMMNEGAWFGYTLKQIIPADKSDIRYVQMPLGPDNADNIAVQMGGEQHSFFFPSNIKDPEAVINAYIYWQLLWDEKPDSVTLDNIITAAYDYRHYPYDFSNFLELYKRQTVKVEENISYFNLTYTSVLGTQVFDKIATQNTTAASAVYALKDVIQTAIDEAMFR